MTEPSDADLDVFGQALADAIRNTGSTQAALATELTELGFKTSQATVSAWVHGDREPHRSVVFAIEKVLGITPGSLSQHLGYAPLEALNLDLDLEAQVAGDPTLNEHEKIALIGAIRAARENRKRRRPPR